MKKEQGVVITSKGYVELRIWRGPTRLNGKLQKPFVVSYGACDANNPTSLHRKNLARANDEALKIRIARNTGQLDERLIELGVLTPEIPNNMPIRIGDALQIYFDLHVNPNKVPLVKVKRGYKRVENPRSLGLKPSWKCFLIYIAQIKAHFGDKYVHEITWLDVKRWRECAERERKQNPATVNKTHGMMIHFFYMMRTWRTKGEIPSYLLPDENPASSRLVKKYRETDNRRDRSLSREEYEKLLSKLPLTKDRIICHFAIKTMLRLADLKALTTANWDSNARRLHGIQSKTQKRYSIPIEDKDMVAWIQSRPKGPLLDFTNFRKHFQIARAQAQIANFQWRDLRRTGASWLRARGGSRDVASKLLGHADTKMTDIYLGVDERDKAEAVAKLNDLKLPTEKTEMVSQSEIRAILQQTQEVTK